ncbi:hypothetical protein HDV00_003207 [Rhizophlyctis rosea]|nr:hypothetical protein HDV00_003207 [Rhizophlyctis rosea]
MLSPLRTSLIHSHRITTQLPVALLAHRSARFITIGRIDPSPAESGKADPNAETNAAAAAEAAAKAKSARRRARAREHGLLGWDDLTFGEKFTHGLKTVGYTGFVLLGLGVIGAAIYYVSLELISDTTAWRIHDESLEKVLNSEAVQRAVGIPITTHGEDGRGARKGKVLK